MARLKQKPEPQAVQPSAVQVPIALLVADMSPRAVAALPPDVRDAWFRVRRDVEAALMGTSHDLRWQYMLPPSKREAWANGRRAAVRALLAVDPRVAQ